MTHRWNTSRPLLALVAVLPLISCTPGGGDKDPSPSPTTHRHIPDQAEVNSLRQQLEAIDGIESISEFSYRKGTFGNGPSTGATFDSTATASPKDLATILDTAYRLTWFRSDLAMGTLIYVVRNPTTGAEAGAPELGFDVVSVGPRELLARYGPAPTTSATPN